MSTLSYSACRPRSGQRPSALFLALSTAMASSLCIAPALAEGHTITPEVSFTLQALYADMAAGERHISGFLPEGHAHGCNPEKLCLDHSEFGLAANLTPTLRASGSVIFVDAEDKGEVEELWLQQVGVLPGVSLKAGRFLSELGYANSQHPHARDFVGSSLMNSVLSGSHLIHDGVQMKWLAPTERFVEVNAELAKKSDNSPKAWSLGAHLGDDLGTSHAWRAGLTYLHAKPVNRAGHVDDSNEVEAHTTFTGTSKTWVADVLWKWAPDGNSKERHLKLQAEYFHRTQDGQLTCEDNRADNGACTGTTSAFRSKQSGGYAQAVYQFMPRWQVGVRYERLDSGTLDFSLPIELAAYKPSRHSVMLNFSPSEMSNLRLQYNRDTSMQGAPDDQWLLQYVQSFGAHGAHRF